MNRIFVLNINGVNWYVVSGGTIVNATTENVNIENYNSVYDINCFTLSPQEGTIESIEDLERHVFEIVGRENMWDRLGDMIERVACVDTKKLCSVLEGQLSFRENRVLTYLDSVEMIGTNQIKVCALDGNAFVVDIRKESIGGLVG